MDYIKRPPCIGREIIMGSLGLTREELWRVERTQFRFIKQDKYEGHAPRRMSRRDREGGARKLLKKVMQRG